MFLILFTRRKTEFISNGNKLIELKVIYIITNIHTKIFKMFKIIIVYVFHFMNMRILVFREYLKKYILRNATKNESELQTVHKDDIYPTDSKNIQINDSLL